MIHFQQQQCRVNEGRTIFAQLMIFLPTASSLDAWPAAPEIAGRAVSPVGTSIWRWHLPNLLSVIVCATSQPACAGWQAGSFPMRVHITKRVDTPDGKRYCCVVVGPNGRIKPDWVMVNGRQEKNPEGACYLDWNEDGKRRRASVGTDAAAAYNSRAGKQREMDATAAGLIVSNPIED